MYLRRSTDRQEASLDDQRSAILRYAQEQGFAVGAEYVDDGVSGTSAAARKGFLGMIADAQSPNCPWRFILVWDIKRFGRMSSDEVGHFRWLLTNAGVEIIFTSEGFTGTSADRYMRFFKQEAARDESATLSKTVIRGMVSLAEEGWWPGGQSPYGFDLGYHDAKGALFQIARNSDAGEKLLLDPAGTLVRSVPRGQKVKGSRSEHVRLVHSLPERVAVVRRVFAWYIGTPSLGFKSIADRLNREGVKSPQGRGWALSSIREMLLNPAYIGRVIWNRTSEGKFHRIVGGRGVERDGCGKRRIEKNAREDWLVYDDAHEPIVDRVTFERAQQVMTERAARRIATGFLSGKAKYSRYLMSGLLRCSCGSSMFGQTVWKKEPRKDGSRISTSYYLCSAAVTKGASICPPVRFSHPALDASVAQFIGDRLTAFLGEQGRGLLRRIVERELGTEAHDPRPQIRRMRARLGEISTKIDQVIDLSIASPENRDLMNDRLSRLRTERQDIDASLRELESKPVTQADPDAIVDSILENLADLQRLFEQGTMEERKRVVRAFVESLTLCGTERSGVLRIKKLPMPSSLSTGSSFDMVAGVGFEPTTFGL